MALSHFSWLRGTGLGSIACWAAFRVCLRVHLKVLNNLLVWDSSIFLLSTSLVLHSCVHSSVYECMFMSTHECIVKGGLVVVEEAKEDAEFNKEF